MAGATKITSKIASRSRKIALIALSSTALALPTAAWADCTASGTAVTCSGTSATYSNTASGLTVSVASGATVTAPLVIGSSATLTNTGTITNSSAVYGLQFGSNANITNNGTITSSSSSSGAGAISVGDNSSVTNTSVLYSYSGTPVVKFGLNGSFTNTSAATTAVTGNIVYGTNTGTNRGYFTNYNTEYGFVGSVTASGNITAYNSGIYTGGFYQTAVSGGNTASFTNATGGTFTGTFISGDTTTLNNAGTMYLYSGSTIGSYYTTGGTSLLSNNGTSTTNSQLWVGYAGSPAKLNVYGNFVQGAYGTLNIPITQTGSSTLSAGTTYSQLYTTGTANLSGTLNLKVSAGFYATGTLYKVVHADGGITGDFSTVTVNSGTNLLFTTFTKVGVVTDSSGADYEFVANHNSYATVMAANGATANQLAVAKGLDKLLVTANADTSSDAATALGEIDILNLAEARGALDQISPEGYLAYGQALRDQANTFARMVDLRMNDQNSDHPEDGWWLSMTGQGSFSSVAGTSRTRDSMFGFSGGYDFSGPKYVYGLAAHASWDKLTNGNTTLTGTNRDYAVAAYGAYKFGPIRASGQLAYNAGGLTTTKIIELGDYSRTANGSASESLIKATAQVGFDVKVKGWTLEPFVGVDFNKGKISSFTESSAGALNLTVNSIKLDRTDILAGVSLTRSTGMFRPYFKATYRNKQSGGDTTVTAYMNGDSSTAFTVAGLSKAKNEVDVNAGLNVVFDDAGALFIGYQGTYRSNYKAHGINLGIRLEF